MLLIIEKKWNIPCQKWNDKEILKIKNEIRGRKEESEQKGGRKEEMENGTKGQNWRRKRKNRLKKTEYKEQKKKLKEKTKTYLYQKRNSKRSQDQKWNKRTKGKMGKWNERTKWIKKKIKWS